MNIASSTVADVVMLKIVDEFHHGVVDVCGVCNIKNDLHAFWQGIQLTFQADEVGENGRALNPDAVDMSGFLLYLIGHFQ